MDGYQERMKIVLNYKFGGRYSNLASALGCAKTTIKRIFIKNGPYDKWVGRICDIVPGLNKEWILTGIGESGISDDSCVSSLRGKISEYEIEISRLREVIKSKDSDIATLMKVIRDMKS